MTREPADSPGNERSNYDALNVWWNITAFNFKSATVRRVATDIDGWPDNYEQSFTQTFDKPTQYADFSGRLAAQERPS